MAKFTLENVRLAGCSLVLGEQKHCIADEPAYYNHDADQLRRLRDMIGLHTRYTANPTTTTADMCKQAGKRLMQALNLAPQNLGGVISVTQTPDYPMPGNAHILHAQLGLPREAIALDVGMGCSGFVYGLWLAGTMAFGGGKPVLLVAGDTLSRVANPHDKTTAPLFGDAGSAALLEPCPGAAPMRFVLRSDGARLETMYVPAGGSRTPKSPATEQETPLKDGGSRSLNDLYMDGFGIFSFTMQEQPALLQAVLEYAGKTPEQIDYFIMHQANRYIVETITKKAGIPPHKAPAHLFSRFGNQNSASIPGVLCGALAEALHGKQHQAVMQGFGIGLSWGACQLELDNPLCLPPVVYEQ